jgi:hypothetical protein
MAAEAFVHCRVTPEMKTLLRTLAEREQITESALVRQLLEVTVGYGTCLEVVHTSPRHLNLIPLMHQIRFCEP